MRFYLRSKIHKATVTEANVDYIGSLTIDEELIDRVGLHPGEKILVVSNTSGARLETYVIVGERGSGVMCMNGAAAHLIKPMDLVIICSYVQVPEERCHEWEGIRIFVDEQNRIKELD